MCSSDLNEADDPSYTQPILYRQIRQQPSVAVQYGERLVREKLLDSSEVERMRKAVKDRLNKTYDEGRSSAQKREFQAPAAADPELVERPAEKTGAERDTLERVIHGVTTFPSFFHLHPKLKGFIDKRKEVLGGAPIDWATGEVLAFGSLVLEGVPVRLSGQDSGRGTFSQRHLVYYDNETGHPHVPLRHLAKDQAPFDVFDSSLSEYAVMGFEFGYSLADPRSLVLWEAQFGDFSNGAQIMIDQFISSSEAKWGQPSGLVLLLPHGYDGQGPEHSSARMERYLQMCAEENMQVVNCSTPAQYFHVLRRQMYGGADRRGLRKPLVIFTPKRLLRHPKAVSHIDEFAHGEFHKVLADESNADPSTVTRIVFCCGQLSYDLVAAREQRKADKIAVVRVEQLYPFPASRIKAGLADYPTGAEIAWVQEEPRNMGAWRFVQENLQPILDESKRTLRYIGRPESASPAAGSLRRHQEEQANIIDEAFAAEPQKRPRLRK